MPRPKPSLITIAVLTAIICGGWFSARLYLWNSDLSEIQGWTWMRADRRTLLMADSIDKKWGKSSEIYQIRIRTLRHLEREDRAIDVIDSARKFGLSSALLDHEQRLLRAQSPYFELTKESETALLESKLEPFDENVDAVLNGLLARKEFKRFDDVIDRWTAADPNASRIPYYKGLRLSIEQKFDEAVVLFEKSYEMQAYFVPVWMQIGKTLFFMQSHEKAIDYLKRVVDTEGDYDEAASALSQSLAAVGRYDEAFEVMQPFINRDDVCSDAPRQLGMVLIGQKKYREAIDAMTPAIKAWPDDLDLNRQMAECYQLLGDDENADKYVERTELGIKVTESIANRRATVKNGNLDPTYVANLCHDIMFYVSRVEGKSNYESFMQIVESMPQTHRDLARFYELSGNRAEARQHELYAKRLESMNATKPQ